MLRNYVRKLGSGRVRRSLHPLRSLLGGNEAVRKVRVSFDICYEGRRRRVRVSHSVRIRH